MHVEEVTNGHPDTGSAAARLFIAEKKKADDGIRTRDLLFTKQKPPVLRLPTAALWIVDKAP